MHPVLESRTALARALAANQPGSTTPHTVVVLPSYSVGDSLLAHYAARLPGLEHRQLHALLMLPRVPSCEVVFVTCLSPLPQVIEYYLSLVPPGQRADMAGRIHVLEIPDPGPRSVSHKLLDRPDLLDRLRQMVAGRIGYVDPWNVTEAEAEVADRIGLPLYGTAPDLWPLGFKSAGRRIMRAAGVPLPPGREDVRSVDDVVAAATEIARTSPAAPGVVVKTDNSGAGDGNRLIPLQRSADTMELRSAVASLEPWYLDDVAHGAVVEELLTGDDVRSPSVQVEITPEGRVTVLSTHEQVLAGPTGQVYVGCDFPARLDYTTRLARYGAAVGRELARRGALGRLGIDFVTVRDRTGRWDVYGLEINLRKGGTTHPYSALRNLVPGRYDRRTGRWIAADGTPRCYRATDNLVDPAWTGRDPDDVIGVIRSAGLGFDHGSGTGVVLHMFCGLEVDGRLGLTAIGTSPEHAADLYQATAAALSVPVGDSGLTVA
ncbi:MAG TPA: peptide ligase PGM1-related protein [Nocardioidaceae bacterium]|nr:peptide ligase PGM1-related protein [Nocardioidaceae bacterium]